MTTEQSRVVATIGDATDQHAPAPAANAALVPQTIDQAMRLAEMMARGSLVPTHLQGKEADCLMVIEQAARWKMSPFAVAQCTSSIKGKLMFEGKLVTAAVHNSGLLSRRLNFDFAGQGGSRAVVVSGTIRGESTPRQVRVMFDEVATDNSMWKRQPDQQLCYAGARVWARRHAPEVMLGVYTPDEHMGDARFDEPASHEIERGIAPPPYPDEDFRANLPKWRAAIESGKKSAEDLIAMVQTKGTLTDDQKAQIRAEGETNEDD